MIAAATSFATVLLGADCWHHGWNGPWFLLFPLFWIAVIVAIIWLFRGRPPWRGRRYRGPHVQSAGELLDHRFARGEIDAEEYRLRRSVLDERDHADEKGQA